MSAQQPTRPDRRTGQNPWIVTLLVTSIAAVAAGLMIIDYGGNLDGPRAEWVLTGQTVLGGGFVQLAGLLVAGAVNWQIRHRS